jgi:hypothetical protein
MRTATTRITITTMKEDDMLLMVVGVGVGVEEDKAMTSAD